MAEQSSQIKPVFQTADVPAGVTGHTASDIPKPKITKKEENQMAEVDTNTLAQQHSDIRLEGAQHTAQLLQENMKGFDRVNADVLKSAWDSVNATKDARFDVATRIGEATTSLSKQVDAIDDTLTAALFTIARDTMDTRAQIVSAQQQVQAGFLGASKDAEINALKTQVELAKQSTYLSDKIDSGNQATQALINALRDSDQNRMLVERNTELVAALNDGRWGRDWGHFRGNWDTNQQFVSSRLNSLDSQLQDTRQGMVNFGTMAGVGQTSTSNNVK
jgi:hypothetical protein